MTDSYLDDMQHADRLDDLYQAAQILTGNPESAAGLLRKLRYTLGSRSFNSEPIGTLVQHLIELDHASLADRDVADARNRQDRFTRSVHEFILNRSRTLFLGQSPVERLLLWKDVHALRNTSNATAGELESLSAFIRALLDSLTASERGAFADAIDFQHVSTSLRDLLQESFPELPDNVRADLLDSEDFSDEASPPTVPAKIDRPEYSVPGVEEPNSAVTGSMTALKHRFSSKYLLYPVLIVIVAILGMFLSRPRVPTLQSRDIITLTESHLDGLKLTFQTDSPEQASRFIQDRFGQKVTIPDIREADLQGVGIVTVSKGIDIPFFLYLQNDTESPLPVFSFSYSFLERNRLSLVLPDGTLRQLEREFRYDVHPRGKRSAILWRTRDDIMMAFVQGDGQGFENRVREGT